MGTGNLVIDAGTEALSGFNTYSGTTTISGGTLSITGNGGIWQSRVVDNSVLDISNAAGLPTILSLSGTGSVALGTQTLYLANAFDTFSGTIAGGGGLTLEQGSETLTGANSYLGATTITKGTLALSGGGSIATSSGVVDNGTFDISATASGASIKSLSGSGNVVLGAKNLTITSGAGTLSGAISRAAGLTVSGGTEILSGTNTYAGGTTISSGTLQLGNGGTTGSVVGNVLDNGTLAFNYSTGTMTGTITGTGAVVQAGNGTTVLAADNTYNGGTTISSGTLQLGQGGTQGSILGNVVDNGTLAFDRSDSIVFNGTISGSGGISQIGTGTTTLTATETYSGTTTIASGTLALSGSASLAASSVVDNGVFDVSATSAVSIKSLAGAGSVTLGSASLALTNALGSFSGIISGSGGVTLSGGSEALIGSNTYTGATTVSGGKLTVDGSITSSSVLTIAAGATVSGTGSVPTTTIASGATLAPGDGSPGTLNISGSATFANASNFDVTVSSTSASKLAVTGAATITGSLNVVSDGGYVVGQQLTVLTAGSGVTGSFSLASSTSANGAFHFSLTQDTDNVYLRIDLADLAVLLPGDATPNAAAVAAGIDAAIAHGDALPTSIENLGNLSSNDISAAFVQLSGEVGADLPAAENAIVGPFLDALISHDDTRMPSAWRSPRRTISQSASLDIWTSVFGGAEKLTGNIAGTGTHNLHTDISGVIVGVDWKPSPDLSLGAAVSGGHAGMNLADGLGKARNNAWQMGGYGLYRLSPHFFSRFAVALGWNELRTERAISVGNGGNLAGQTTGFSAAGHFDLGVNLRWGITPYVGADSALFQNAAYSESASAGVSDFALHYGDHSATDTRFEAGLEKRGSFSVWDDGSLTLDGRVAWAHDMDSRRETIASFEVLPDSAFTVEGAQPANSATLVSFGTLFQTPSGVGFLARFDGEFSDRSQSYAGTAGLDFKW
jgi:autotransporter-associated beta strand protein